MDVIGIIEVLGHRPHPYPENIQKYINETKKQIDEKKEKQNEESIKKELKDNGNNNSSEGSTQIDKEIIKDTNKKDIIDNSVKSNTFSFNYSRFVNMINFKRSFYYYKREYIKGLKLIYRMTLKNLNKFYKPL